MLKALLVGEAFGEKEAMFQHPFVGPAGVKLGKMMAQTGLGPALDAPFPSELQMLKYWDKCRENSIDVTNVFNVRPENNQVELFFTSIKEGGVTSMPPLKPGKYLRPEMLSHILKLRTLITEQQPNLVIALGNVPSWAILGETKISVIRGTIKTCNINNIKVFPTYHPSAVLHQPDFGPIVLSDFEKCLEELKFKEERKIPRWILIYPTLEEINNWINHPANSYAVDIESGQALYTKAEKGRMKKFLPQMLTILAKQISMIGFARDPYNAMVVPFMSRNKPDLTYWPDAETEFKALKLCQKALQKPISKIFQNGMYDIPMLLSYKLVPSMCDEDTMLLHHSLYPELPKSLGFLASIYENMPSWKAMYASGENLKRDD